MRQRPSQPAQPLAPDQLPQVAAGQQGEHARPHTGRPVQALHGLAVAFDVAPRQVPERTKQAEQGHRHQQMDGRVARQVGQLEVADEQGRKGRDQHQRDPGIARGAVQPGALPGALPGPKRHRSQDQGAQGGAEVDGDGGRELHGGVLWKCRNGVEYGQPAARRQRPCDELRAARAKAPHGGAKCSRFFTVWTASPRRRAGLAMGDAR